MSRRSKQWQERFKQSSGNLDKLIPEAAKSTGAWLTGGEIEGRQIQMPEEGSTAGKQVTLPMTTRKEQLVRQWCR